MRARVAAPLGVNREADRTPFFGPLAMRVGVGFRSSSGARIGGCHVVEGLVGSVVVVLLPPVLQEQLRLEEAVEGFEVE
jgi:hypothetical protein